MARDDRPDNREVENENLRADGEGRPPRPATEPAGAQGRQAKTMTDPSTGALNPGRPGGEAGGTYAQDDQSDAAKRSRSHQDQRPPK